MHIPSTTSLVGKISEAKTIVSPSLKNFISSAQKQGAKILYDDEFIRDNKVFRVIAKQLPSGTEIHQVYDKNGILKKTVNRQLKPKNFLDALKKYLSSIDIDVRYVTEYKNGKVHSVHECLKGFNDDFKPRLIFPKALKTNT